MPSWTSHGPLSLQSGGALRQQTTSDISIRLKVVEAVRPTNWAGVSASTVQALGVQPPVYLQLCPGSDCIVLGREDPEVADGCIALSDVQQYNLRIKAGLTGEFRVFCPEPGQSFELQELEAEVSLLGKALPATPQVDAVQLALQFGRAYFGCILAVNECCVVHHQGLQLLVRVTGTDSLTPEEQEERVGYHCYRGLVTPDTQIFLTEATRGAGGQYANSEHAAPSRAGGDDEGAAERGSGGIGPAGTGAEEGDGVSGEEGGAATPQSALLGRARVCLINARKRDPAQLSRNTLKVTTSDGEWFPVRRKLLRPCIALTRAVRSEEVQEIPVDVDTLTFDRVLIYLEAEALGRPPPGFGVHVVPELLEAAQKLGLRSLEAHCRSKLGEMKSRLQWFTADEVKRRNSQGECLLMLDGMVLDVTRWLPEHPGGSTIIPRQSLNLDCSRFFELYHSSRESFLYIQEFYIGEVYPEDKEDFPRQDPSSDFLQQLREFTGFRMQPATTHTHLGSKH